MPGNDRRLMASGQCMRLCSGGASQKNEVGRTHCRLRAIPSAGAWRSRKGSRCSGAEHGGLERASSAGAWRGVGGGGTIEPSERDGSAVPLLVMVCCLP
jgi:hypothetical protein